MTKICPFCGGNKLKLDSKARKVAIPMLKATGTPSKIKTTSIFAQNAQ